MAKRRTNKDYSQTRKLTSKTPLGKIIESLGLKDGLNKQQVKSKIATMSQKTVKQALKRAALGGAGMATLVLELAPVSLKASIKEDLTQPKGGAIKGRNKPRSPVNRAIESAKKATANPPKVKPKSKSAAPSSSLRPRVRPTNKLAPSTSLRPKKRPTK